MKKRLPEPYLRGKYYYFVTYKNGRRTLKSTGCTKKTEARDYIASYTERSTNNQYFDTNLRDYSDRFFVWDECPHTQRLIAEKRAIGRKHVVQMRSSLTRYVWADPIANMLLHDITRGAIVDFRTRVFNATKTPKRRQGYPNAANKALKALKIVLSEAAYREDLQYNPAALVTPIRYEPKKQTILSAEELRSILKCDLPAIDQVYVAILAGTGMRAGELRALSWEKIRDDYRTIEISATMKDTVRDADIGACKWDSNRTITIPAFLSEILAKWHEKTSLPGASDPVIYGKDRGRVGQTWTRKHFNNILDIWADTPPNPRPTPHTVRHSVNTTLLISGVSPLAIAQYLGWSAPLVSRVQAGYSHLQLLDTQVVADALQSALGRSGGILRTVSA